MTSLIDGSTKVRCTCPWCKSEILVSLTSINDRLRCYVNCPSCGQSILISFSLFQFDD